MMIHESRMMALIEFTRKNSFNEPYGCAIYDNQGKLLVEVTGNKASPINHAEILAINQCAKLYPGIEWHSLSLYSTGEPCCMCASACCWANLDTVVYATPIPFMMKLWNIESSKRALEIMQTHPKVPSLIAGVCEEAANELFLERQELFAQACSEKRWL